jgi:hypothetical protein
MGTEGAAITAPGLIIGMPGIPDGIPGAPAAGPASPTACASGTTAGGAAACKLATSAEAVRRSLKLIEGTARTGAEGIVRALGRNAAELNVNLDKPKETPP